MKIKENSLDFFKNTDENHCVRQLPFHPTFCHGFMMYVGMFVRWSLT